MRLPNRLRVFLNGGTGNQLFQISAARLYAQNHSVKLAFDPSWTAVTRHRSNLDTISFLSLKENEKILPRRPFALSAAELVASERILGNKWLLDKNFRFRGHNNDIQALISVSGVRALAGVFADPSVHHELALSNAQISVNWPSSIGQTLPQSYATIHVRGGDYFQLGGAFGVLSKEYFKKALDLIPDNIPHYWVTNDVEYATEVSNAFPERANSVFGPEEMSTFETLKILSESKYLVASNSTLSWWGNALSRNNQTAIGPSSYSPQSTSNWMITDSWVTVEACWHEIRK